uniref:Uncharacterized protein n=1 Tax=Anguilla anguilla TaxID=7936 RepID=A0A0E9U5X5_ANGAN
MQSSHEDLKPYFTLDMTSKHMVKKLHFGLTFL